MLSPSDLIAGIRFPSVIIITGERALVHYDLLAISKVLPTVPRIRFSCILCTWFPLRRSDDKGHSIRWVTFDPVFVRILIIRDVAAKLLY